MRINFLRFNNNFFEFLLFMEFCLDFIFNLLCKTFYFALLLFFFSCIFLHILTISIFLHFSFLYFLQFIAPFILNSLVVHLFLRKVIGHSIACVNNLSQQDFVTLGNIYEQLEFRLTTVGYELFEEEC